jgi:hypothetical protein
VGVQGGSLTSGAELPGEGGFTHLYNLNAWDITQDSHVAGQASAVGLSIQGISVDQIETLKERLENTKNQLNSQDFSGINSEHISGDLLTSTVWGYFSSVEAIGNIVKRPYEMVDHPGLSYGLFHAQVVPQYRYGVVTSVSFPGVVMDIAHQRRLSFSKTNNLDAWINYNRFRGEQASSMEHVIPETFFLDNDQSIDGISAVKAIAIASNQGQKIYTITEENKEKLNNIQHSAAVMENIRNSISSGKEVTIHERPINHAGFSGAGYVITDPETGAGAYLIEGGANGVWLAIAVIGWIVMAGLIVAGTSAFIFLGLTGVSAFVAATILGKITAITTVISLLLSTNTIRGIVNSCYDSFLVVDDIIGVLAFETTLLLSGLKTIVSSITGILASIGFDVLDVEPTC